MADGPLILGATGQIGRAWRLGAADVWAGVPIWQARQPEKQCLTWDILQQPAPDLRCSGIVSLAGSNRDTGDTHIALAQAACDLGARLDVPVLIASSQAVYGVQAGALSEQTPCQPAGAYGAAKYAMERSVAGRRGVTCLRIGNLPGADALFRSARQGPVGLDQWPDGQGPRRSMIGLQRLALVVAALLLRRDLPPVLNIAQPGLVAMADLLAAAGADWHGQPAPATAVRELALDVSLLQALVPLPVASASQMVAEARACGCWP